MATTKVTSASKNPAGAIETVALEAERLVLANDALFEITILSKALRAFIQENDTNGQIVYATRGVLARVQELSEAVSECIEHDLKERGDDNELVERIECRRASKKEAANV